MTGSLHRLWRLALLGGLLSTMLVRAQNFSIDSNQRILDPEGREFVPIGANVSGARWAWPYKSVLTATAKDRWENGWRFNMMRVNNFFWRQNVQTNSWSLEDIVNYWTTRKVVVLIAPHDIPNGDESTGKTGDLVTERDAMAAFWSGMASNPAYKNNPYVWFTIVNEPGNGTSGSSTVRQNWVDFNRASIQAIRAAGASNMIVVNGLFWGQDADNGNYAQSAIVARGQDVVAGYQNVIFSTHVYRLLDHSVTPDPGPVIRDYIDAVRAKGLVVFLGEIGSPNYWNWSQTDNLGKIVHAAMVERRAGVLAWHWSPGDGASLVSGFGDVAGDTVDSITSPTNLHPLRGQPFWDATHSWGFGLGTGQPPGGPPPPQANPDPVILGRPINLSVGGVAGSGEGTLIGGFTVEGTEPLTVLLRVAGPALVPFGVPEVVSDPKLRLFKGPALLMEADDWPANLKGTFAAVGAFGWADGSKDAALVTSLTPGSYTIHAVNEAAPKQALIEIYDISRGQNASLTNLSCRVEQSTQQPLIVGLTLDKPVPVLLRNGGPSLRNFEVPSAADDTRLTVFDGQTPIAENDDWDPALRDVFVSCGAYGYGSSTKDAALRMDQPPRQITVHARSKDKPGVGIVELYLVK